MKHYKSKKRPSSGAVSFFIALVVLLLILLVGKIGWLGRELSDATAAQVRTLFSSDLGGYVLTIPKILTAIAALAMTYVICPGLAGTIWKSVSLQKPCSQCMTSIL